MDAVCEECGDAGYRKLLLRCSKCKSAVRHRYCLDAVTFDSVVDWSCSSCIPKHNEGIESLEGASLLMLLSKSKLGCSMINEPNVDNEKVTRTRRPRTIRPHRIRNYHVDESTKHFLSGDTSNLGQCRNKPHEERRDSTDATTAQFCSGDAIDSCEVFVGDIPNRNDCEKEGVDRNGHLTCAVKSSDGSSDLPLDHASEFEPNNLQRAMDGSKLASNSTECTDLSNINSGCFVSSKYVEGLKLGLKLCPTLASVDQAAGLLNREQPEPPKAVKGFEKSVVASMFAANSSIQGPELKVGSADVLSPIKQHFDSCSMVPMQSSPSNELEDVAVQENSADVLSPLKQHLDSFSMVPMQSSPSNELEDVVVQENSADVVSPLKQHLDSWSMVPMQSSPSNKLEDVAVQENSADVLSPLKQHLDSCSMVPMQSSPSNELEDVVVQENSADVVSPLKQHLDSWSMVPMQSSPSNVLEDVAVQENSAERTRCLVDEQTNVCTMENLKVSKPSMENECLVSNEGNSEKENRKSDEVLLSTKAKKTPNSADTETLNAEPAKGDQNARNRQCNAGKPSSLDVKKMVIKRVLQEEGINSELLSSKFVGPCESTKINPRKRKQSESYNSDGTKIQKIARSKGGRPAPAASLRDRRNMPGEDNGSNDKVIGHSRNRRYKKTDKSWLANKASRHVRKQRQPNQRRCSKRGNEALGLGNLNHRCIDMQPLDKPYWTGIMKIDDDYVPLAAHLSTKAGKKLQEQSRSLPPRMNVTKFSTSKTCPKHLEAPIPSVDSIGLYFFSSDMRPNKELDQLVKHVADSGIILEAIVGLDKLFLFPSSVLPEEYQTFQGKLYLSGVFKPRKDKIKRVAPVEQDCMFKPRKDKIKRLAPIEQDCMAHITKEEHVQKDQQDKAQGDTLDQVTHPENQPLLDAKAVGKETLSGNGLPLVDMRAVVSANISPADHGQPCSNPEAPPSKLCGFVVSRTPRSAELIQEMQKEGALLFAVHQVMTEPGSVV